MSAYESNQSFKLEHLFNLKDKGESLNFINCSPLALALLT